MSPITIRRVSPEDWQTWRELRLAALADAPTAFGSTLVREQAYDEARWRDFMSPRWGVKVIAADDEPVGLVAGLPHQTQPDVLYVVSMWVRPSHQGRGIGAALISDVLAWAHQQGRPRVRLRVTEDNDSARRLYERLGFTGMGDHQPLGSDPTVLTELMECRLK